jgi:uncharacterized integral membrane protein
MNKLKFTLILIIAGIVGLFVLQNMDFLLAKKSFSLNLFFIKTYSTPELPTGIILLISFLAGLLVSYVFALFERFSLNGEIKGLNYTIDSNIEKIAELKNEVISLKKKFSSEQKE